MLDIPKRLTVLAAAAAALLDVRFVYKIFIFLFVFFAFFSFLFLRILRNHNVWNARSTNTATQSGKHTHRGEDTLCVSLCDLCSFLFLGCWLLVATLGKACSVKFGHLTNTNNLYLIKYIYASKLKPLRLIIWNDIASKGSQPCVQRIAHFVTQSYIRYRMLFIFSNHLPALSLLHSLRINLRYKVY